MTSLQELLRDGSLPFEGDKKRERRENIWSKRVVTRTAFRSLMKQLTNVHQEVCHRICHILSHGLFEGPECKKPNQASA